jgi:hypothetical protein
MRLLLGVVVINLMVLALGATSLWSSHQQEIQTVEIRSRNIAAAVSGNIGAAFEKVDVALRVRGRRTGTQHAGRRNTSAEANEFIGRQQQYVPEIDAIRVANAAGRSFSVPEPVPGPARAMPTGTFSPSTRPIPTPG